MKYLDLINSEIPSDDSASIGEKMILYWLIRELKPETVIETGTHKGLATAYMAHALYDNQKGHIYTADPFEWGQKENFSKIGEIGNYITYYQERGEDMIKKIDNIDFAFIDGFHEKNEVLPEIEALIPRLSKNAIVVFHDCWYGNTDEVNEALEGLETLWLPTKNAIRIYGKSEPKRTS